MSWWEILLNNLPTFLLLVLAAFFVGAELIKSLRVWRERRDEVINQRVAEREQQVNIQAEFDRLHARFDEVDKKLDNVDQRVGQAELKLHDLTISDMHDIRAWIVQMHRRYYIEQGWIDAFTADALESRYADYKNEGGNSYIEHLMDQLRTLPMDPAQSIHKDRQKKK